jgi:hypothetical protein
MIEPKFLVSIAEKQGWVCVDWQKESCLTRLWKDGVYLNIWSSYKKTTIGIQYQMNGATKHKYIYYADLKKVREVLNSVIYQYGNCKTIQTGDRNVD